MVSHRRPEHVWSWRICFRNEAEHIKPGMKVKVTLPHEKKEFHAVVARSSPVRCELAHAEGAP